MATADNTTKVALVTGGSSGLGRELVRTLSAQGWRVVTDARDGTALTQAVGELPGVEPLEGDILDFDHQDALTAAVERYGRLDLLIHNASTLGPTPLRPLRDATVQDIGTVLRTNAGAPLALTLKVLPLLRDSAGVLIGISSDAAVEHYEGWGLYGAGKAALDHFVLTLGAEEPAIVAYAVDPGDMRTPMHQAAFSGEDISDRPEPGSVVPHLMRLWTSRPPTGRYRASELPQATTHEEVVA